RRHGGDAPRSGDAARLAVQSLAQRDDAQYSNKRDFSVPQLFDDGRALLELLPVAAGCSRSVFDRALQIRSGHARYFFPRPRVQLRPQSVFLWQGGWHQHCRAGLEPVPPALPEGGHDARWYWLIGFRDQRAEDSKPADQTVALTGHYQKRRSPGSSARQPPTR